MIKKLTSFVSATAFVVALTFASSVANAHTVPLCEGGERDSSGEFHCHSYTTYILAVVLISTAITIPLNAQNNFSEDYGFVAEPLGDNDFLGYRSDAWRFGLVEDDTDIQIGAWYGKGDYVMGFTQKEDVSELSIGYFFKESHAGAEKFFQAHKNFSN